MYLRCRRHWRLAGCGSGQGGLRTCCRGTRRNAGRIAQPGPDAGARRYARNRGAEGRRGPGSAGRAGCGGDRRQGTSHARGGAAHCAADRPADAGAHGHERRALVVSGRWGGRQPAWPAAQDRGPAGRDRPGHTHHTGDRFGGPCQLLSRCARRGAPPFRQ